MENEKQSSRGNEETIAVLPGWALLPSGTSVCLALPHIVGLSPRAQQTTLSERQGIGDYELIRPFRLFVAQTSQYRKVSRPREEAEGLFPSPFSAYTSSFWAQWLLTAEPELTLSEAGAGYSPACQLDSFCAPKISWWRKGLESQTLSLLRLLSSAGAELIHFSAWRI